MTSTLSDDAVDFDSWYTAVRPRLVRTVTALVRDRAAAEEICAEAFVRAFGRWGHVGSEVRDPDAWVFRVAINLARRSWRARLASPRRLPFDARGDDARTDHVPDVDLWRLVYALPERQRQVIVLRYVGDLTESSVADVLGISTGSVSASLTKARSSLRAQLTDHP
jgi:RNA polymerase sigma-70 factor (ECF subfamily)